MSGRLTSDIISHVYQTNKKVVLVAIDFEKCFDRLEHESIFKVLKYFKFGETFISWVKLFFTDFTVCTQNNGHLSEMLDKKRGCNQGCPISPFCYLVSGETLAHLIQQNTSINGVTINSIRHVITQFADDTGIFIEFTELALQACIEVLTIIDKNLGLKVSYDKTCIYRLGSLKNSNAKLYSTKQFKWSSGYIDMLGVKISNAPRQTANDYNATISKMENVLDTWSHRKLTLMGKVVIFNSLCASLFIYKMIFLPKFLPNQIERIDKAMANFLWNGKKAKIPTKVLELLKEEGGLKLTNLIKRHFALSIKWVIVLQKHPHIADYVYQWLIPEMGSLVWKCNLKKEHVKQYCHLDSYWLSISENWCELNAHSPKNKVEVCKQIIWYNSELCINGKLLIPIGSTKRLLANGMLYIEDLLTEDGRFLNKKEAEAKFQGKIHWLWYQSLIHAIPKIWKNLLGDAVEPTDIFNYDDLKGARAVSKIIYDLNISKSVNDVLLPYLGRLNTVYINKNEDFLNILEFKALFRNIYKVTTVVKLRNFQYRFLLGKIFTNTTLYKWKIVQNHSCNFCNKKKQTVIHLFWECAVTKTLWKEWSKLTEFALDEIKFKDVLTNHVCNPINHVFNLILLILKQYIFRCKCEDRQPNVLEYKTEIKNYYFVEASQARTDGKKKLFSERWSPISSLFV